MRPELFRHPIQTILKQDWRAWCLPGILSGRGAALEERPGHRLGHAERQNGSRNCCIRSLGERDCETELVLSLEGLRWKDECTVQLSVPVRPGTIPGSCACRNWHWRAAFDSSQSGMAALQAGSSIQPRTAFLTALPNTMAISSPHWGAQLDTRLGEQHRTFHPEHPAVPDAVLSHWNLDGRQACVFGALTGARLTGTLGKAGLTKGGTHLAVCPSFCD